MYIINLTNNIANETPVWSITKAVRNCITNKAITCLNIRKKQYNTYQWLRRRHAVFENLTITTWLIHWRARQQAFIVQPILISRRADTDLSSSARSRQVVVGPTTVVVGVTMLDPQYIGIGIVICVRYDKWCQSFIWHQLSLASSEFYV